MVQPTFNSHPSFAPDHWASIDPEVRQRILIETRIAQQCIRDLLDAGYTIDIHDGEAIALRRSTDPEAILAAMMSVDEEHLIARTPDGKKVGSVFFVYGNDGWDAINDYSTSLEPFLARTNALADQLANDTAPTPSGP